MVNPTKLAGGGDAIIRAGVPPYGSLETLALTRAALAAEERQPAQDLRLRVVRDVPALLGPEAAEFAVLSSEGQRQWQDAQAGVLTRLEKRVDLRVGSATALPLADGSVVSAM